MVAVGGGGGGARRRRAWRWAMRAAASAVLWTAVVQVASIAGLFRPRVLADCGGKGGAAAASGLAALAGEDSLAARLSPPALVPKSEWPKPSFVAGDLGRKARSPPTDLGGGRVECGRLRGRIPRTIRLDPGLKLAVSGRLFFSARLGITGLTCGTGALKSRFLASYGKE
jgi:hypothetical protein